MKADIPLAEVPAAGLTAASDTDVCAAAVEPVILVVRAKHPDVKRAVHAGLPQPRRALFTFWVAHGHARGEGWSRLFLEVPYLAEFEGFFADLEEAYAYFGCREMAGLAEDASALLTRAEATTADWARLDAAYRELAPACLHTIAERIRDDPGSYFEARLTGSPPLP